MRITYGRPLPRVWRSLDKGIIAEADLRITARGRLRAKLLVFDTPRSMNRFWKRKMKSGLGRWAIGAVNGLASEIIEVRPGKPEKGRIEVDPRYFCVIGLTRKRLTMEVISHEAVHAGFAYAKRVRRTPWAQARLFDEEEVAYPAGAIARQVNLFLDRAGLYH